MNDEQIKQALGELRIIRICAVIAATIFILSFLQQILNIHI
jgi:hypothetical protein